MIALEAVPKRLQQANMAAKPSKCYVGYSDLPYLGHEVGDGKRWPDAEKIEKVKQAIPPTTKKELRSFLGLTGFYRSYIRDYSGIAIPLTDMTKKDRPDKLRWNDESRRSFEILKDRICEKPVLCSSRGEFENTMKIGFSHLKFECESSEHLNFLCHDAVMLSQIFPDFQRCFKSYFEIAMVSWAITTHNC